MQGWERSSPCSTGRTKWWWALQGCNEVLVQVSIGIQNCALGILGILGHCLLKHSYRHKHCTLNTALKSFKDAWSSDMAQEKYSLPHKLRNLFWAEFVFWIFISMLTRWRLSRSWFQPLISRVNVSNQRKLMPGFKTSLFSFQMQSFSRFETPFDLSVEVERLRTKAQWNSFGYPIRRS